MVFDVTTTEFRVRAMRCLRKIAIYGGAHGFGIAGEDVSIDSAGFAWVGGIAIAGGTVDEESDGVGVCDFNCGVVVLCRQDLAACGDGEQLCMKAHAGLMFLYRQAGVVVNGKRLALHEEPIVRGSSGLEAAGAIKRESQMQGSGLICGEPDHDDLIRCGGKDLSCVADVILAEADLGKRGVEIEL